MDPLNSFYCYTLIFYPPNPNQLLPPYNFPILRLTTPTWTTNLLPPPPPPTSFHWRVEALAATSRELHHYQIRRHAVISSTRNHRLQIQRLHIDPAPPHRSGAFRPASTSIYHSPTSNKASPPPDPTTRSEAFKRLQLGLQIRRRSSEKSPNLTKRVELMKSPNLIVKTEP